MIENQSARLVAFVEARLNEDEATAKAASAGGAWRYEDGDPVGAWTLYDEHWAIADLTTYRHTDYDYAARMPTVRHPGYVDADANGRHIVRHDPARVLREVEAKRAILGLHAPVIDGTQSTWVWFEGSESASERYVRLLALPYADHPDYDEAWRT